MTNEQAIEVLHELDGSIYETQQVALDMAIKALEQQPSEDAISREDAMSMILCYGNEIRAEIMDDIKTSMIKLPSVTPTQSWIPIITREPTEEEKEYYFEQNGEELCYMIDSPMPDNGQEVLVSGGSYVSEDIFDEDFWDFEKWDIKDVDAWMPLPKPYEKRGNENVSS